jgi:tripartite-type tricarboxylate transporter receptor subunit TctC
LASLFTLVSPGASAQAYPSRPVRIIVPFPPGGGVDVIARVLAQKLGDALKQSFVVENRIGASGTIGGALVAKAPPDGYTLLLSSSTHVINGLIMKTAPYDAVADFTPISRIGAAPLMVAVHPSVPVKDLKELLQLKDKGTPVNWAVSAIGTADHLVGESLRHGLGIPLTIVPYKGQMPAINDAVGGQVSGMSSVILPILSHLREGRLRPIAVTSTSRNPGFPNIPTLAESGLPGFELTSWYGLWGPKGLPRPLVDLLVSTTKKEFQGPDIQKRFPPESFELLTSTPEEFSRYIEAELARCGQIVREAKISIDNL